MRLTLEFHYEIIHLRCSQGRFLFWAHLQGADEDIFHTGGRELNINLNQTSSVFWSSLCSFCLIFTLCAWLLWLSIVCLAFFDSTWLNFRRPGEVCIWFTVHSVMYFHTSCIGVHGHAFNVCFNTVWTCWRQHKVEANCSPRASSVLAHQIGHIKEDMDIWFIWWHLRPYGLWRRSGTFPAPVMTRTAQAESEKPPAISVAALNGSRSTGPQWAR